MRRIGIPSARARASSTSSPAPDQSTAVTCWPRAPKRSACLPVPHATSSAGPRGNNGKSSPTMLAGSVDCAAAVSLYFSSQSDWLDDIKKAPERNAQEPRNSLEAYLLVGLPQLDAEGAAAAACALHVGIIKFESRTFDGFDVIDLNAFEVHGTHLVHRNLQTVKLENLVRIRGLVLKGHVVLETRAAAADYCHTQRDRHRCLHVHDFLDLSTCNGRQIDHSFLGLRSQAHLRCSRHRQYSKILRLPHSDPVPVTKRQLPRISTRSDASHTI